MTGGNVIKQCGLIIKEGKEFEKGKNAKSHDDGRKLSRRADHSESARKWALQSSAFEIINKIRLVYSFSTVSKLISSVSSRSSVSH